MGAGGFSYPRGQGKAEHYEGGVTAFFIVISLVAAMGGLVFGYKLGISGDLASMKEFVMKIFPSTYARIHHGKATDAIRYCNFEGQMLTLFNSSLYIVAMIASVFASIVMEAFGRKASMSPGGLASLLMFFYLSI